MAHSYIKLDFGTDEEKAQQARPQTRRLENRPFRLDKKAAFTKLDRPEGRRRRS